VDVTRPSEPKEIASYGWPDPRKRGADVALGTAGPQGRTYAYIAHGGGLRVLDVTTPSQPAEVGSFETPVYANRVAVSGNYVYLAIGDNSIRILDVSAPAEPREVGVIAAGEVYSMVGEGRYLYIGYRIYNWPLESWEGIQVVDVSNPSAPRLVAAYEMPEGFYAPDGLAVAWNRVYAATGGKLLILRFTGLRPVAGQVYLPLAVGGYGVNWEGERNDHAPTQANGPLTSGVTYRGRFASKQDESDYFFFALPAPGRVEVLLSNTPGDHDYDLALRDASLGLVAESKQFGPVDERVVVDSLPVGRYYIQVYRFRGVGGWQPYHLRTVYE
jgi:hypothetical protein